MERLCLAPLCATSVFGGARQCCPPLSPPSTSRRLSVSQYMAGFRRFATMRASAGVRQLHSEAESDEEEEFDEAKFEAWSEEEEVSESEDATEEVEDFDVLDVKPERKGRRLRRATAKRSEVPSHLLAKVAIVGRPNVGKSAIFNRIAGKNMAIVHDEPGVTRDRLYARAHWCGQDFMLVDTGGVLTMPSSGDAGTDGLAITSAGGSVSLAQATKEALAAGLPAMIEQQAASAVEEASALIFVVDGQVGPTAVDIDLAHWLRKKYSHKRISLAVNKCESPTKGLLQAAEFWSLGFTPIPVSAISRFGISELLNTVCSDLKIAQDEPAVEDLAERPLGVAIIGRPNVGKSSIVNALVGEERTIVSPVSGTTRDAIDTEVTGPEGRVFRLIDTAGIRKRAAIATGGSKTESLCVGSALRAIRRSDVVALVIDAMECVTEQDCRLGERIEKDGKGCIIVINKWDTVPNKNSESTFWYEKDVREKLRVLKWAPIVYTSAASGQRVTKILEAALRAGQQRERRVGTAIVNQVIQEAISLKQPPTTRAGKKGRVYFCTQAANRPPTFVFFVNDEELFPDDYKRYLEKQIRKNIGFPGTPIRLHWRSKKLTRTGMRTSSGGVQATNQQRQAVAASAV